MLPVWLQRRARSLAETVVRPLSALGLTPDALTVLGLTFNIITAGVIGAGYVRIGAVLLLLSGAFDMLDGALARVAGAGSRFGAFLDSLLDRYAESFILLGVLFVFAERHKPAWQLLLVYIVAIGSLLISYARARAEGVGVECKVGIAPRPERILLLGLGLLINDTATIVALIILAVLTHVTALQRLHYVWRLLRSQAEDEAPTSFDVADHVRSADATR